MLYLDVNGHPFNYQQILFAYNIQFELGHGKYGKVFKIQEKKTNQDFAMKVVKIKDFLIKADTVENCFREQKALMQLNHSNIVKLHNAFIVKDKI